MHTIEIVSLKSHFEVDAKRIGSIINYTIRERPADGGVSILPGEDKLPFSLNKALTLAAGVPSLDL